MSRSLPDQGFGWAQRFNDEVREAMREDPSGVAAVDRHRDFADAVPTPDHFIPLLYVAGVAGAAGSAAEFPADVPTDNSNS